MSDTTFANLITNAVAARMTSDFIEKEVNSRVEKLITESIDRALRTYSDTGKMIEKAVEDALRVERLDLPTYGNVVSAMVKAQIEAKVSTLIAGRLAEDVDDLLSLAPKEVKLSKIAEDMLKQHEEGWGPVITVIVEHNDYGSTWVYLDDENVVDRRNRHQCAYRLLIGKDGKISSATLREHDIKSSKHIGISYGLEQKLRAYFACGTVIELDEDYVSTSVGDY